jgi:HlyD family secretion protein
MDIARPNATRRRIIRRTVYSSIAIIVIAAATLGVSRLKPADPTAERSTLVFGTVKRGLMLREVHGMGKFVPEETLWIPAPVEARVERVMLLPGTMVKPETVLVELSNHDLLLAAVNAEWTAKSAEAELISQKARLRNDDLQMQSSVAREEADYNEAKLQLQVDEQLFKDDLIAQRNLNLSRAKVENLEELIRIDKERLDASRASEEAQLAVANAKVEQTKAEAELKRRQVDSLKVKADVEGVLEQVKAEVGQHISAGTILAKVTNPKKLKAALKIPETQARDIVFGQKATIDTRSTILSGRVVRIDPASEEGNVTVDVAIDDPLPRESHPDLSVDGTIELERLENVLYVGRPVYGQADSTVSLFKTIESSTAALRIPVKLGRISVSTVEIREGLNEGDEVILSDTHEWDSTERIRLR